MKGHGKWNLSGSQAIWAGAEAQIAVDTVRPDSGAALTAKRGNASGNASCDVAHLFGVPIDQPVASSDCDTYCRVGDLITRYQPTPPNEIAAEVYWRPEVGALESDAEYLTLEMIYSLQTDRLDAVPNPVVTSAVHISAAQNHEVRWFELTSEQGWSPLPSAPAGERSAESDGIKLVGICDLPNGQRLLQTVFPSDFISVNMEKGTKEGETGFRWQLRSDFLEKGVIRRMRLFAGLAGSSVTDQQLLDVAVGFYQSELPLAV